MQQMQHSIGLKSHHTMFIRCQFAEQAQCVADAVIGSSPLSTHGTRHPERHSAQAPGAAARSPASCRRQGRC